MIGGRSSGMKLDHHVVNACSCAVQDANTPGLNPSMIVCYSTDLEGMIGTGRVSLVDSKIPSPTPSERIGTLVIVDVYFFLSLVRYVLI